MIPVAYYVVDDEIPITYLGKELVYVLMSVHNKPVLAFNGANLVAVRRMAAEGGFVLAPLHLLTRDVEK